MTDEGLGPLQGITEFLQVFNASPTAPNETPPIAPVAGQTTLMKADITATTATSPTQPAPVKSDATMVQMLAREFKISVDKLAIPAGKIASLSLAWLTS